MEPKEKVEGCAEENFWRQTTLFFNFGAQELIENTQLLGLVFLYCHLMQSMQKCHVFISRQTYFSKGGREKKGFLICCGGGTTLFLIDQGPPEAGN